MRAAVFIFILIFTLLLGGCASLPEADGSPKGDYARIKALLDKKNFDIAITEMNTFASKHPYSEYSIQTELLQTYANYKQENYDQAEVQGLEFLRRHPRHPDVAYARYLLGMIHYEQVSPPKKDQTETSKALTSFQELLEQHPDSTYAEDVKPRILKLRDSLAQHEFIIGQFYYKEKRYVAAANRFQTVVEKFQTSPVINESLYYLTASYLQMEMVTQAKEASALLKHNYPNSKWSNKAEQLF